MSASQLNRVAGTLLAAAVGDVMGVPYEPGDVPLRGEPELPGGGFGGYAPGEWSDDTQMALYIARVAATGADLTSPEALDEIARGWCHWVRDEGATDVGAQTRVVINAVVDTADEPGIAHRMHQAAAQLHERTGRTAGNGALMRNSAVALTRLADRQATAAAARAVAELTHADPLAGDSCVIHAEMIRANIMGPSWSGAPYSGAVALRTLDLIPPERRQFWHDYFDGGEADTAHAEHPPTNDGFTVSALAQSVLAWTFVNRAAYRAGQPAADREQTAGFWMRHLLLRVLDASQDKDTVAAITGALAGSYLGAGALEAAGLGRWVAAVQGLPHTPGPNSRLHRAEDLRRLACATALAGLG